MASGLSLIPPSPPSALLYLRSARPVPLLCPSQPPPFLFLLPFHPYLGVEQAPRGASRTRRRHSLALAHADLVPALRAVLRLPSLSPLLVDLGRVLEGWWQFGKSTPLTATHTHTQKPGTCIPTPFLPSCSFPHDSHSFGPTTQNLVICSQASSPHAPL